MFIPWTMHYEDRKLGDKMESAVIRFWPTTDSFLLLA